VRRQRLAAPLVLLALASAVSSDEPRRLMRSADLARLPQPPADQVIAYGKAPQQHAELRLPKGDGPHPVVIVIHGGCWQTPWAADHVRALAAALTAEGYATWSLEYRRLGDPGGGWPGTLEDVGRGADALRGIATARRLDLSRVAALGHSAGGQLALWLAARRRLPEKSALHTPDPLPIAGVVSLAGITDLQAGAAGQVCGDAIPSLLGGAPEARADRVAQASPIALLPLGVPQRLVCGALDTLVPNELSRRYLEEAERSGDPVTLEVVQDAGHFELVDPHGSSWRTVREAVDTVFSTPKSLRGR
jgi:acetyl esterase/lipase